MKYDSQGGMAVRTLTAGGALPVKDAVIQISGADEENEYVVYSVLTDLDGITSLVSLPTPIKSLSETPNASEQPYANYNVIVTADGYYPKRIYNIPIFEGTNTLLPINMIPKSDIYNNEVKYPRGNLDTIVFENEKLE